MQFEIGDWVLHRIHGTGQIVAIKEKQFSGKGIRLYYEVALPKLVTLWVPVETLVASKLRLVTVKTEFDQSPDLSKIAPVPLLNTNYQQRPFELVSRLKKGSVQRIRTVVRELTAWGWRKSYRPDRYAHRAEDTTEPLSKMGDEG